ncbi:hypothetical protein RN001_004353 [Aquatica leii]|uniref:Uncharacterized protein n=1 Tax=Aquatica leii TaxID=1421715 RepID=A0AAN7PB92_9COLE|nr:hypothetical protein RN001_004353 [Aquatica leii]
MSTDKEFSQNDKNNLLHDEHISNDSVTHAPDFGLAKQPQLVIADGKSAIKVVTMSQSKDNGPGPSKRIRYGDKDYEKTFLKWVEEVSSGESEIESDADYAQSDHDTESEIETDANSEQNITEDEELQLAEQDTSTTKYFYGKNRYKWSKVAAKADRYETPDALYAEYLSTLKPENCAAAGTSQHLKNISYRRPLADRLEEPLRKKPMLWVNGKPLQAYVDSGCGAVLITKSSVDLLGLETIPCTEFIIRYGGSSIEPLGKVKLNLKVDSAAAELEALVVPNVTQNIPVLVGQTFLNNNEVVMIVAGDKVRILSANSEFAQNLDICPGKVPLWAKTSTVIAPRTTALLLVTFRGICNANVYVQGGLRMFPGKEHVLDGCITKAEDGIISITNLSGQDSQMSQEAGHPDDSYFEEWCLRQLEEDDYFVRDGEDGYITKSEHDTESEQSGNEELEKENTELRENLRTQDFFYGREK